MPKSVDQLFITRLKLENWRNFKKAEIKLRRRIFLIGANASGNSNSVDATKFLRDLVIVGGGFESAISERGEVSSIRCLAARQNPAVRVEVDVGTESNPIVWSYGLRFNGQKGKTPNILEESVWHDGNKILDRPDPEDRSDPQRLHQTAIQQVISNREFRPLAEFFASIRYVHLVPQLIREPERRAIRPQDPYGSDFLEQLAGRSEKQRSIKLKRIEEALAIAVPQLGGLRLEQDHRGLWHLRAQYVHWRPHGAWQDERSFSDGTLRLLGLLWSMVDVGGPLLLEEPELSLHPAVVRHIPAMFHRMQLSSGRQVIVTTHSAELLADEGVGLDEVHMLLPAAETTEVVTASTRSDIRQLIESGLQVGEVALASVAPPDPQQLAQLSLI